VHGDFGLMQTLHFKFNFFSIFYKKKFEKVSHFLHVGSTCYYMQIPKINFLIELLKLINDCKILMQ